MLRASFVRVLVVLALFAISVSCESGSDARDCYPETCNRDAYCVPEFPPSEGTLPPAPSCSSIETKGCDASFRCYDGAVPSTSEFRDCTATGSDAKGTTFCCTNHDHCSVSAAAGCTSPGMGYRCLGSSPSAEAGPLRCEKLMTYEDSSHSACCLPDDTCFEFVDPWSTNCSTHWHEVHCFGDATPAADAGADGGASCKPGDALTNQDADADVPAVFCCPP